MKVNTLEKRIQGSQVVSIFPLTRKGCESTENMGQTASFFKKFEGSQIVNI